MDIRWQSVDPLGEALHFLRLEGIFYSRSELSAPWAFALPTMPDSLMFHVVTAGRCWLEVAGAEPRSLGPGDLALVPHGGGHRLGSAPGLAGPGLFDLPREYEGERYEIIRFGGGGARTTLICGAIRFQGAAARHLVGLLPPIIGIEAGQAPGSEWLSGTLRLMATEARELRPGGEAVITRLADIVVIQAIRAWLEGDPAARTGWLGALRDPQIGRAITLIHRDAARPWTVAALADAVAMSRSAFAARFAALVGEPPMGYVARWRMQAALGWLREGDATLAELAARLGYGSEAAFSRAFKRFNGISPGAARRQGEAGVGAGWGMAGG